MQDKLIEALDDLNIKDTTVLLDKDINLNLDTFTRKRIEKSIMKKTGCYKEKGILKNKINRIFGDDFMKKKIALAVSIAVILSFCGGGYAYAKNPVAYVSVDINPSVELGVNAFDRVVSVESYNEDGKNVLEGTDLVNKKIEDAVDTVISNAIDEGYVKKDGSSAIEITTATDKDAVADKLDESLKEAADKTLDNNNVQAEVEADNVALARRDEARKLGITPGKLNLIQKLQALDENINVEDYKNSSVKDIQKKVKELRKGTETQENAIEDNITEEKQANEEKNDKVKEEKKDIVMPEQKTNNGNNAGQKDNNNSNGSSKSEKSNGSEVKQKDDSSKTEKINDSNSKGNANKNTSLKSDDKDNGNSNSQNKGNSKNKGND